MTTVIDALRKILGTPDFYNTDSGYSGSWDYGAMIEYFVGALILCIVVASIFKILAGRFSR